MEFLADLNDLARKGGWDISKVLFCSQMLNLQDVKFAERQRCHLHKMLLLINKKVGLIRAPQIRPCCHWFRPLPPGALSHCHLPGLPLPAAQTPAHLPHHSWSDVPKLWLCALSLPCLTDSGGSRQRSDWSWNAEWS